MLCIDQYLLKLKFILVSGTLLLFCADLSSQEIVWEQFYPAGEFEMGPSTNGLVETADGGVVIAGYMHGGTTSRVMRISPDGNVEWNWERREAYTWHRRSAVKRSDGSIIIMTADIVEDVICPALTCLNEDGEEVWNHSYPSENSILPYFVFKTEANNLVLYSINRGAINELYYRYVYILDDEGNLNITNEYQWSYDFPDLLLGSGCELSDGRLAFTGTHIIDNGDDHCRMTLFECDSTGDSLNFNQYAARNLRGGSVKPTLNEHLVIAGSEAVRINGVGWFGDAMVAKLDQDLELVFHHTFDAVTQSATDAMELSDGNIAVTFNYPRDPPLLVIIDEEGNIIWELDSHGYGTGELTNLLLTDDGVLYALGVTSEWMYEPPYYYWLIKIDPHLSVKTTPKLLPELITIFPPYPNPFNSSTNIRFGVPKAAQVSLQVYDLSGRQITELVGGRMNAGWHTAVWDASGIPTGQYLVRLSTPEMTRVQKVVLVK